jgi:hypothetical protein
MNSPTGWCRAAYFAAWITADKPVLHGLSALGGAASAPQQGLGGAHKAQLKHDNLSDDVSPRKTPVVLVSWMNQRQIQRAALD